MLEMTLRCEGLYEKVPVGGLYGGSPRRGMSEGLPQVGPFRKRLEKVVGDKHEEVMCRMGAIMATGILDAGGR